MDVGNLKINLSANTTSFSNSMQQVNRALKTVNSEFNLSKSTLKNYGNDTDSLKIKSKQLSDTFEIQKIKVEKLKEQYEKSKEATGENSKATQDLGSQYNNAQAKLNELSKQLEKTNKELDLQSSKWQKLSNEFTSIGGKFTKVGEGFSKAGKDLSLKVTAPLVAVGAAALKSSVDWESAFTGVKKTVDGTTEQIAGLEKGIRDMTKVLPSSSTEIAAVAEAAGQLGIETDSILGFTKTIIDLGNATNLTGEQGASSLAKFANITKMSQKDFDRLGSTIVALGNNSATTESDIVDMAMRLAGAGTQVGMTEAQILSLSAALSSVGIEAEAGGSAFSKVLVNMQLAVETGSESLNDFASVAGMTTTEFSRAFKEDATGALTSFIQGLSNAEDKGSSAIKVLDDMGITEVRLRDSLLRASGASELFNETISIGTQAWEENTALTNEAEQRYGTTASQIEIARNKLSDLGVQIGEKLMPHLNTLLDKLSGLIDWFSNLSPEMQDNIVKVGILAATLGPLFLIIGKVSVALGSVFTLFGTVSGAIAVVTTGAAAATPAIGFLAAAFTFITGPIGIAIAAIAAVIAVGVLLYKNWDTIKEKSSSVFGAIGDTIREKLNAIKNFMSNLRLPELKIPKIKLPHFSLTGEFSLMPPRVPSLNIDWYSTGAIFTRPTVLGGIGVGDANRGTGNNAEAVIPLDSMYKNLRNIIKDEQSTQPIYVVVNVDNNMDSKAIGKAVTTEVKKEITRGTNNYKKGKGGLSLG